jgi:tRNA nucleotidyltransferase (CCA-adding enzyme)
MANTINEVLKNQIALISPSKEELNVIKEKTKVVLDLFNKNIKKAKISAQVFVGGSFAKNTLIKKKKYDVDIFIRFDKKYGDKISSMLGKIVPKNAQKIHGSRDYFSFKDPELNVEFEIIPTIKVNKPEFAQNITDLSYFHVNYVAKELKKNPKLVSEIRLAKAFMYYQDCYGAESYINGFSGYAVELLVINYKSFLNFIKAVTKNDFTKKKIILDPAKKFKNKETIERELNEAKLQSPIVLIDPTFKDRNALAALSYSTFDKFKIAANEFLKNPSSKFFEFVDKERNLIKKYGARLVEIRLNTDKQAGDIAGTKLKKFYSYFIQEVTRFFNVKTHEFFYDDKNNVGKILIVVEQKDKLEFSGPPITMKEPLAEFKKEHKKIIIRNGKAFAYRSPMTFDEFFNKFSNEKSSVIEQMSISRIEKI